MMKTTKKRTLIEVTSETHALARRLARETGTTMSGVIGAALTSFSEKDERTRSQVLCIWEAVRGFVSQMDLAKK